MMRDQLRLVLQPDDQLVKITTVIAIDDHSGVERMRHVILSRLLWETASDLVWPGERLENRQAVLVP